MELLKRLVAANALLVMLCVGGWLFTDWMYVRGGQQPDSFFRQPNDLFWGSIGWTGLFVGNWLSVGRRPHLNRLLFAIGASMIAFVVAVAITLVVVLPFHLHIGGRL